jgi:hypothetical protein
MEKLQLFVIQKTKPGSKSSFTLQQDQLIFFSLLIRDGLRAL